MIHVPRSACPDTPRRNHNPESPVAKAVRFYEAGGPEVLRLEDVSVGEPGAGEIRVRRRRAELRRHLFPSGLLPCPAAQRHGRRGCWRDRGRRPGIVTRPATVTYTGSPLGAYSTERVMPVGSLFKLPDGIELETAAAMTMRGLSAAYWLLKTNPWMKAGDTILLHAAAGGVGLIASQWAKLLGLRVIGTVSSEARPP